MNDHEYPNEGRDAEACRVATEALVVDVLESWMCRIAAAVVLALLVASHATTTHPVVLLELLAQAAINHPVEAGASFAGVAGTLLLATRTRLAGFGFVAFLASNAGWLWFAREHGHAWMFWQQMAFTIGSLVGVWVWLVRGDR